MNALAWYIEDDDDDRFLREAGSDPTVRRAQRAAAAGREILSDRYSLERTTTATLLARLKTLKTNLQARILDEVTDFRRMNVTALVGDVDQLITSATRSLATTAGQSIDAAAELGEQHADEPMKAAQLAISARMPGLDRVLVQNAFDNTADLLTSPMQAFRQDIISSIRRVAVAGDNRQTEINRLRDKISGAGFDSAAYRAERIVRTEVNRIFSMATYDRMVGLANDFPFLRKGWRASRDRRTRLGHAEAHQTYGRGNGILIADRFKINVHNERPGKPAVLIGTAQLRFPLDPDVSPGGRVGAAATIMCRCGAFVDFDINEFQQYSTAQVSLALTGIQRGPAPELPAAPKKLRKAPAVRQPKVLKAKPLSVVPGQVTGAAKPVGTPVGNALDIDQRAPYKRIRTALALIDQVHGDGELAPIKVGAQATRARGRGYHAYYDRTAAVLGRGASTIGISSNAQTGDPYNTAIHEAGHWLDHKALPEAKFGQQVVPRDAYASEHNDSAAWENWRTAAKQSRTIQQLERWRQAGLMPDAAHPTYGYQGDGVTPRGAQRANVNYLLTAKETWARSYAQYVVVRSGDTAALAELRRKQAVSSYGPVKADTPFNRNGIGKPAQANTWDYPVVWQDDEFEPIANAIDQILENKGWRSPGGK